MAYETDNEMVVCEQCGNEYKCVGTHWSQSSSCEHPSLTQHQREMVTGILMGDGTIDCREGGNPRLRIGMITKPYLEHVAAKFGVLGSDVYLEKTAEESARQCRDRGFRPGADAEDYSDVYEWQSMRLPELQEFAAWYDSGSKVWPSDIELTPTVLKHWYCGDGHWNNHGSANRIEIAMSNEIENTDKIDQMFENSGLPSPHRYNTRERKDGSMSCDAIFTVEQSKELWDYMGKPLPGFEYKWPEEYH